MSVETLYFTNDSNERFSAKYSANNSKSLIYIIPGNGESANNRMSKRIAKIAKEKGIDSLRIQLTPFKESATLTKSIEEFLIIHNKMKDKYDKFYFSGFSYGSMVGLIIESKIKLDKLFLLSTGTFIEYRTWVTEEYLNAWKEFDCPPDYKLFKKGIIKPQKFKINYGFILDLKKYNLNKICSNINTKALIVVGDKEEEILDQAKYINDCIKCKHTLNVIRNVDHNSSDKNYLETITKLFLDNLE